MNYRYSCISPPSLNELEYIMDNNEEIKVDEFKGIVGDKNFNELCEALGYDSDFKIDDDWHVTYHKGKLPNNRAFAYLQHSSIEYIYY